MWIKVTQVLSTGATQWLDVNTEMIESIHVCTTPVQSPGAKLTFHLQSGRMIDISEDRTWWEQHSARSRA